MLAATHTATELMQLAEAETIGVFNDHQRRVGDVHTDLDHRCGDQDLRLPGHKGGHHGVLVPRLHLPVHAGDVELRKALLQVLRVFLGRFELDRQLLIFLHHGADDKDLTPPVAEFADEAVEPRPIALVHGEGIHLLPSRRELIHDGDVQVTVNDQGQCAGDRGRGHDQHVGPPGFPDESGALLDAETVLFVRDDQAEIAVLHIGAEKGVGADDQIKFAGLQRRFDLPFLLRSGGTGKLSDVHAEGGEHTGQSLKVLLCQNLGGSHKCAAQAVLPYIPDERGGDQSFAAAHIALYQTIHHDPGLHICRGLLNGTPLGTGGGEGKTRPEFLQFHRGQADAAVPYPLTADPTQRAGEDEEFLENQAPARQFQRTEVGGEVDVLIGIASLNQLIALPHRFGQNLRQQPGAAVKALPDTLHQNALIQPGAQAVNRHDAPGDAVLHALPFIDGIDQAAAGTFHLNLPIKDTAVTAVKRIFHIGLIEICDVNFAALINGPEADEIQPAADPGELGSVGNQHRYAYALTVLGESDGLVLASIFIAPGKKGDEVIESKDAELVERLRLFLPDSFDVTDVRL